MRPRPSLGAVVAGVLAACAAAPPPPDAIASVGDEGVSYTAFSAYVERETESSAAALESSVLSSLLDQYLTERLLTRMAVEEGLVEEGSGHRRALSALLQSAPVEEPLRSEVLARYRAERERFVLPRRVRLRQVLTETRDAAEAAHAELVAGADFGDVARRYSREPSAVYGGDQGELAREDLPDELGDAIFALEPGEVSDVIQADYGFHVFQVTERLPERIIPFEEAEGDLAARLREERVQRWLAELVESARSRYTVRVYEENLPFEYGGFASPADSETDA